MNPDFFRLQESNTIHQLRENDAMLKGEIRDSYRAAKHDMTEAKDAGEVMRQFGRMEAMRELMVIFQIEGV